MLKQADKRSGKVLFAAVVGTPSEVLLGFYKERSFRGLSEFWGNAVESLRSYPKIRKGRRMAAQE